MKNREINAKKSHRDLHLGLTVFPGNSILRRLSQGSGGQYGLLKARFGGTNFVSELYSLVLPPHEFHNHLSVG